MNTEHSKAFEEGTNKVLGIKNARELIKMTDEELARWQVGLINKPDQDILCNQEWQRRASNKQIKTMYVVAVLGIIGTITGALGGAFIGNLCH